MTSKELYNKGYLIARNGEYESAIQLFTEALNLDANYADAFSERGVCYFHLKQFHKAISDLNKAVEIQPNNPYRYSSRAFVKGAVGDIDGGMVDYEKAVQLDPDDAVAYNNLGLLQEQKGYKAKSEANFKKADSISAIKKEFENLYKTSNKIGSEKVLNTAGQPKINTDKVEITEEVEESQSSFWNVVVSIVTDKNVLKEFSRFIKNGFKLNN